VKKIGKTVGLSTKIADTKATRKGRGVQENSTGAGTFHGGIIATETPRHGELFGVVDSGTQISADGG
jgi:hypothetical protein